MGDAAVPGDDDGVDLGAGGEVEATGDEDFGGAAIEVADGVDGLDEGRAEEVMNWEFCI